MCGVTLRTYDQVTLFVPARPGMTVRDAVEVWKQKFWRGLHHPVSVETHPGKPISLDHYLGPDLTEVFIVEIVEDEPVK